MSDDAARELNDWLEALSLALGRHIRDGALWAELSEPDDLPPVDFAAELRSAKRNEALLVALWGARRIAYRVAHSGQFYPGPPGRHLIELVAVSAAKRVMQEEFVKRFVGLVPGSLPDAKAVTAWGRICRAMETAPEAMTFDEILARAGVSRATGYRLSKRFRRD